MPVRRLTQEAVSHQVPRRAGKIHNIPFQVSGYNVKIHCDIRFPHLPDALPSDSSWICDALPVLVSP